MPHIARQMSYSESEKTEMSETPASEYRKPETVTEKTDKKHI